MGTRPYTQSDYPIVASWWAARQFPALHPSLLPQVGIIVDNHAVGFLYATDSGICWMEWITTNPASDKIDRDKALNLLIEALTKEAKARGFKAMFSSVGDKGLIERYGRYGFVVSDTGATNMVRML